MRRKSRLNNALRLILPGGALGASLALSMAAAPIAGQPTVERPAPSDGVATRLQAIREGVSQVLRTQNAGSAVPNNEERDAGIIPTWWGNGGWGRWHLGWGNGGFGWPNWHNWGNGWNNGGWNNWGNGWHNYWHNA